MNIKKTALLSAALIMSMFAAAVHAGAEDAVSVDDKFTAIQTGETLTLESVSTLEDTVTIDGKKVTLDLNGQTLTVKNGGFLVDNGAELTITDTSDAGNGTIDFAGKPIAIKEYELGAGGWVYADHGSSVIMEKGKILTSGEVYWTDISYATHGSPTAILGNDFSTVTVNGGEIEISCITHNCYAAALFVANSSTLNFNGGKIYASIPELFPTGIGAITSTANINGGSIDGVSIAASVLEGGTMSITGGELNSFYCGVNAQDNVTLNITGGTVTADEVAINFNYAQVTIDEAVINGSIYLYTSGDYDSILKILSGTINGEIIAEDDSWASQPGKNDITISGGTFSVEPDAAYIADGLTAEYVDGSYIIKEAENSVTVTTEYSCGADGANGTQATGFITTISGKVTINSVKWAVTYNEETRYTAFTPETAIVLDGEGDAKIGLVVNGFNDSSATAEAEIK